MAAVITVALLVLAVVATAVVVIGAFPLPLNRYLVVLAGTVALAGLALAAGTYGALS